MPKSKLQRELKPNEDGTVLVPKEIIPVVEVSQTAARKAVKREMSDKQRENMEKMIQANKERWIKIREEKMKAEDEEKSKRKEDEQKLLDAGTHVRVKLKEKKVVIRKPKAPRVEELPEEEEEEEVIPQKAQKKPRRKPIYESDTPTETEDDTDFEEDKPAKRTVRREVKKNLKALERIDSVLASTPPTNPYMSMLQARWK